SDIWRGKALDGIDSCRMGHPAASSPVCARPCVVILAIDTIASRDTPTSFVRAPRHATNGARQTARYRGACRSAVQRVGEFRKKLGPRGGVQRGLVDTID